MIAELVASLLLGVASLFGGHVTRRRGDLAEVAARHPQSAVRRAELVEGFGTFETFHSVEFVVANRRGLAFLDSYGGEEHRIPLDLIDEIELLSPPGADGQHIRVSSPDEAVLIEFWSPDDAGDVRQALVQALPGNRTR